MEIDEIVNVIADENKKLRKAIQEQQVLMQLCKCVILNLRNSTANIDSLKVADDMMDKLSRACEKVY